MSARASFAKAAIAGAGLATVMLPVHALTPPDVSRTLAAMTLAVVAAIYVGFALADGGASIVTGEVVVALAFGAAALGTLYLSPWIAVVAFVAHGLWDVAHHRHVATRLPRWYIPFCAVLDWVFAAGFGAILIGRHGASA